VAGRYRGPLHGVPIAVKDLCFTKGFPTMGGMQVLKNHVPAFDATVVSRLAAAGAVLLGKLNTAEGAQAAYHPDFEVTLNPWDTTRWAGASSSGSASATAAGLCFGALGTDTLGSIRFPSACCGVVGLKPTYGRVSRFGVLPLAESLDHIGPMARSSKDVAIILAAIAGSDVNDPTSLPGSVPSMLEGIETGVSGLRIGFDEEYATQGVAAGVRAAVSDVLALMEELGAHVVPVQLPPFDRSAASLIAGTEAVLSHSSTYPSQRDLYGPWFREYLDRYSMVTGAEYANAHNARLKFQGAFRRVMAEVDALVCPTMPFVGFTASPERLKGTWDEVNSLFPPGDTGMFARPFNMSGSPTICFPCGFSQEGLPYSVQFVGKHLDEALLCRIGYAYEQMTNWHIRHPSV